MHGPATCHQADPWLVATRLTYHLAVVTCPPLDTMCSCLGTCVQPLGDGPVGESASHTLNELILLKDTHMPLAKDRFNICDMPGR